MKTYAKFPLLALSFSALLSACGGGGGGGANTGGSLYLNSSDFAPVVGVAADLGSDASAEKVLAAAVDQATNAGVGRVDPDILTGVQAAQSQRSKGLTDVLSRLPRWLTAKDAGVLAGAETSEDCPNGGTITAQSNSTSRLVLWAGADITVTADRCTETVDGETEVVNGTIVARVASGSFGEFGPREPNTRLNFDFRQFQVSFSDPDGSGAVGLDGGLSVLYDQGNMDRFTSTPLPGRPTFTTAIDTNGSLVRDTISNFELRFQNAGVNNGTYFGGRATVDSNSPKFGLPSRYFWLSVDELFEAGGRVQSGGLILSSPGGGAFVRANFGQPCPSGFFNDCVTIQRTVDSVEQPVHTLTWSEFEAL